MKAWISKYALTTDVYEKEGQIKGSYFVYVEKHCCAFLLGRDAHLTKEAALLDAERRRAERIASLEKQIAKLKALKFK